MNPDITGTRFTGCCKYNFAADNHTVKGYFSTLSCS